MIDDFVIQTAKKCLLMIEKKYQCHVILAGFVGSQVIGLHNANSDYDVRAVAIFTSYIPDKIFDSFLLKNTRIEIMTFPFERVISEIEEWSQLKKVYPTILSDCISPLVHQDVFRAQFRLAVRCLFSSDTVFLSTHIKNVQKGLAVRDQLDYDYSRAYINLKEFLSADIVNVRKYLYTINEILSIRWGLWKQTFPPDFLTLLQSFSVPDELNSTLNWMIERNNKEQDKAKLYIPRIDRLNFWLQQELIFLENNIRIFSERNGDIPYFVVHQANGEVKNIRYE